MRSTILKWVLLTALFAYVACVAVWANRRAAERVCTGVDIEIAQVAGADSVTVRGVDGELKRYGHSLTGTRVADLNTRELENYLGAMSMFENVECVITTDGILRVEVKPMVPEIRVFDGDRSYYLNKDGKRIDSKASFFVDVPVVKGNFTEAFPASQLLTVTRFVQSDPVLKQLVAMVEARDPRNIHLVPRIRGHLVNLGDTAHLERKRDALLTFYRKVMPYKGWDAYDTISVKFDGQIVATRRDKSPTKHAVEYNDDVDMEESTLPTGV